MIVFFKKMIAVTKLTVPITGIVIRSRFSFLVKKVNGKFAIQIQAALN